MLTVLQEFIGILVGAIVDMARGVAAGIVEMAKALFLETSEQGAVTGLSIFGGIVAIFAGIALCVTLTTRVYLWVTSLGKN